MKSDLSLFIFLVFLSQKIHSATFNLILIVIIPTSITKITDAKNNIVRNILNPKVTELINNMNNLTVQKITKT